jgi:hypothetical protein
LKLAVTSSVAVKRWLSRHRWQIQFGGHEFTGGTHCMAGRLCMAARITGLARPHWQIRLRLIFIGCHSPKLAADLHRLSYGQWQLIQGWLMNGGSSTLAGLSSRGGSFTMAITSRPAALHWLVGLGAGCR